MFTSTELIQKLPVFIDRSSSAIEIVKFDSLSFSSASTEEEIEIHQGRPSEFEDLLHFWVKSLMSQDWSGKSKYFLPYAESGKCKVISEDEFNDSTKYLLDLKHPPSFPLHSDSPFICAMQMYDDWNDEAAIAAYEDRYISFYWNTSA